jgi:hypothetical protein
MKWIPLAVLALILIPVLGLILGSRLPREHVAAVRARYAANPEAIWAVIAEPAQAASWRKDVKRVDILSPIEGKAAWREESGMGKVTYVLAESERPKRMATRIVNDDLPYGGEWDFVLEPAGPGTDLTITERGFVKPALFRFLSHYIFGYTSTLEKYERALGARLGESVTPVVIASGR